jgi:tetratricopeptide (TPR) repeat protein
MQTRILTVVVLFLIPSLMFAGKLRARFVDQEKKVLSNVECKLVNTQSHEEQGAKGNKKGEAEFKVAPGTYELHAQSKDHLVVKSDPIQVSDQDSEVTLVLPAMDAFKKIEAEGNAAFEKGEFQVALENYQKLLDMSPTNAVTWSNVARAQAGLKNRDKAKEAAQKAAAQEPEQFKSLEKQVVSWVSFAEGREFLEQKQFPKAVASLTEATEGDPNNAEAFYGLALAYGHQGKYDEALKYIDQAIKLKPGESGFTEVKKILEHNAQVGSKK